MKNIIAALFCTALTITANAQKIVYSEPDRDETRRMNFEVIGKVDGNYLVYKNFGGKNYIGVYNNEMVQTERVIQDYLTYDRFINVDFFPYANHAWMVYQYQRRNVVYCDAVKIDGTGRKQGDVISLDTTHIGFSGGNRIYSVITSEDRNHIMLFKINSRNKSRYLLSTILFDKDLYRRKFTQFALDMEENDDYLDKFNLDNDGDLVFSRFNRNNSDNIVRSELIWKPADADSVSIVAVPQEGIYLDEPHIKVDNANKRYFLTSFYYKQRRGNIEGFYFYTWDKTTKQPVLQNSIAFNEELRSEARGEASVKTAFNDYFIRNVIVKRDGGFIIGSEAYYTTSRFNNWNRWNYLYGSPISTFDYYAYSPMYSSWLWRNQAFGRNQAVRHHADNITILAFDKNGKPEWNAVIHKGQFDDESDDRISYNMMLTGNQVHFVFNQEEKRNLLLNDFTLSADGEINRNPTLKNLDKGYEFMPKYGKQVSARQMIIPCYYRNYICFAKVEFN